jgi:hypothetical protein
MKPLLFIFLAIPTLSQASLVRPELATGANFSSEMREVIQDKTGAAAASGSCESTRAALLAEFAALEQSGAAELSEARAVLEKAVCPAEPNGAGDLYGAQDHFLAIRR